MSTDITKILIKRIIKMKKLPSYKYETTLEREAYPKEDKVEEEAHPWEVKVESCLWVKRPPPMNRFCFPTFPLQLSSLPQPLWLAWPESSSLKGAGPG